MSSENRRLGTTLCAGFATGGCNRVQSAFAPFGEEAESSQLLMIVMTVGAVIIFTGLLLLMRHAQRAPEGSLSLQGGMRFILVMGGVLPALALLALLLFSLPAMRPIAIGEHDLKVIATGEQFWWRMRYEPHGAVPFTTANQLRIPVGRAVEIELRGTDVIHSFWVPGLAGKMDMIPGRANRMVVRATKPGRYRGQCTEFCGLSHALMAFEVVAMEPAAFDRWMAAERTPAAAISPPGRALFDDYGCAGCHRVAGHGADGTIGPDLTHFAARQTFGATTWNQESEAIAAFIRHPERFKPGVRMPAFDHMSEPDARAIAAYLLALK